MYAKRPQLETKVTPKSWTLYQRHLEIFVSGFCSHISPRGNRS